MKPKKTSTEAIEEIVRDMYVGKPLRGEVDYSRSL